MHYYIDGYNLMFRVLHAGEDLQVQRQKLIDDLYTKIHFLGLNVTLVFDSQYYHGESSRTYKEPLVILFTALGETADDLILDAIKKADHPEQNTVVTSDKKLAWLVRRRAAKTETVEEFITWLNKRFQNKRRHLKEKSKKSAEKNISSKKIVKQKEAKSPLPQASPESCIDFYLDTFEKGYQELKAKEKPKESPKTSVKKKRSIPKHKGEIGESDMQRWQKIFESKLEKEES